VQQTMVLGSTVHCTDGNSGSVSHIVVNPDTYHLEYLVVHRGLFGGHDHSVPVGDLIDADSERVDLTIASQELKALPELEVRLPDGTLQRSVSESCPALHKGTAIKDVDGNLIGHFHGVVTGSGHQVERLLLSGSDDAGIPIANITEWGEDELTARLMEQTVA